MPELNPAVPFDRHLLKRVRLTLEATQFAGASSVSTNKECRRPKHDNCHACDDAIFGRLAILNAGYLRRPPRDTPPGVARRTRFMMHSALSSPTVRRPPSLPPASAKSSPPAVKCSDGQPQIFCASNLGRPSPPKDEPRDSAVRVRALFCGEAPVLPAPRSRSYPRSARVLKLRDIRRVRTTP